MAERGRWREEEMSQLGSSQEKIDTIIREAREKKASDIHLSEGMPIWYRVNGRLIQAEAQIPSEEMAEESGGGDLNKKKKRECFLVIRTDDRKRSLLDLQGFRPWN